MSKLFSYDRLIERLVGAINGQGFGSGAASRTEEMKKIKLEKQGQEMRRKWRNCEKLWVVGWTKGKEKC